MTEKENNVESPNLYEFEILKQRYESLEKTFTNVEKEKEYYQVNLIILFISSFILFLFRKFMNKQKKILNISKKNI
jgi:hypothetical protein